MKKILLLFFCSLFLVQGCSHFEDELSTPDIVSEDMKLPSESEAFGKSVAKELRVLVTNLNNKGIDYTQANKSPTVKRKLFKELYRREIPEAVNKKSSNNNYPIVPYVPSDNINMLTDRQVALIKRIFKEYKSSKSNEVFFEKLKHINKEIYTLPKIEQERIFHLSAAMYYGLKEVKSLRKKGLMAPAGSFNSNVPRLKSYSVNGEGSGEDDGECRQTESAWAIAVGSEILLEGIKYVVKVSTYSAATALWLITACTVFQEDTPDYEERCKGPRDACVENPWKDGVRLDCQACYQHCLHNYGDWRCPVYE